MIDLLLKTAFKQRLCCNINCIVKLRRWNWCCNESILVYPSVNVLYCDFLWWNDFRWFINLWLSAILLSKSSSLYSLLNFVHDFFFRTDYYLNSCTLKLYKLFSFPIFCELLSSEVCNAGIYFLLFFVLAFNSTVLTKLYYPYIVNSKCHTSPYIVDSKSQFLLSLESHLWQLKTTPLAHLIVQNDGKSFKNFDFEFLK